MLESLKFFLERVNTYNKKIDSKLGYIAAMLTFPILLLGWVFVKVAVFLKFLERLLESTMEDNDKYGLGYCPKCNEGVYIREKRLNGDDICVNGHRYPSKDTLKEKAKK